MFAVLLYVAVIPSIKKKKEYTGYIFFLIWANTFLMLFFLCMMIDSGFSTSEVETDFLFFYLKTAIDILA